MAHHVIATDLWTDPTVKDCPDIRNRGKTAAFSGTLRRKIRVDLLRPLFVADGASTVTRLLPHKGSFMATGLIALLDDVAAIAKLAAASLDDVAAQTAKAGAKAAGVVIDDAAVTPRYVVGLTPE